MTAHLAWMIVPAAVALDLAVGDPQGWPHPVRWMGRAIEVLEPRVRRFRIPLVASGAVMTLVLVAAVWAVTAWVIAAAAAVHPLLGTAVEIVLMAWILSMKSLCEAGTAVRRAFGEGGIDAARRAVAMIVGRETAHLDRAGVCRAAVESMAENLVDGIVSPLFYAALGGAPLAMAYKMVNTLDSMIGYRNARYEKFGKVAARLDDVANFVPARLCVPAVAVAAHLLGGHGRRSLAVARRDGRLAASPNAGYPEAAFSGALGVRLAGPAVYFGRRIDKPRIGAEFADPKPADIDRAGALLTIAGLVCAAVAAVAAGWLR
ncbi:MAG: adenosylcobinamide-phosphate synthase CbiB [Pseudomonadota bacterium]